MQNLTIKPPSREDVAAWSELRLALWPKSDMDELVRECLGMLEAKHEAAFLAWHEDELIGFIEGSMRGSLAQPYGHVEGWYVVPGWRHKKTGAYLMGALEEWLLHHGIELMHSDTTDNYPLSPAAHARAGFEEVQVIRVFRKRIAE